MDHHYSIRELAEEEFCPLFDAHKKSAFADAHSCDFGQVLSDAEREQIRQLGQAAAAPYKLHLGVFDRDNNFVGWSWGYQESPWTFYMVNSAILEGHRRKGLYGALLAKAIEVLSKKGFQLIYSRHCTTNNPVIIPKLKAGFIIAKMEIDDRFGVLLHLHFYVNETRRKIMDYRCGQLKADAQIKEIFNL